MDPRVQLYTNAFCHHPSHQFGGGGGAYIPVFAGASRYQYGQGIGDVIRGILRFFRPVAIKGAQTLLKAGSEAIKEGASVKDVLSSTLKPALGAVLGATAEQVQNRFLTDKSASAPPPGPALEATVSPQSGSGSKRKPSHPVYKYRSIKRPNPSYKRIRYNF